MKRTVRVVYVIPSDATPWDEAKRRANEWLEDIQWFFADQMDRWGYGPKTFQIATDKSGDLLFHQIGSPLSKEDFRKNPVRNCRKASQAHALRKDNDIVVYFHESYSVFEGRVYGAGAKGTRRHGGEAFLSSIHLKMARREWITDTSGYEKSIFEWISKEPMKADTLSWNKRGKQLGDVSGSAFGMMAHELGHCFGITHDRTDDRNRRGNLMGNGCRGMRGYFRPDLTRDFCVLSEKNARILNQNPFFAVRVLKPRSIAFQLNVEK